MKNNFKRSLALILSILMLMSIVPVASAAAEGWVDGELFASDTVLHDNATGSAKVVLNSNCTSVYDSANVLGHSIYTEKGRYQTVSYFETWGISYKNGTKDIAELTFNESNGDITIASGSQTGAVTINLYIAIYYPGFYRTVNVDFYVTNDYVATATTEPTTEATTATTEATTATTEATTATTEATTATTEATTATTEATTATTEATTATTEATTATTEATTATTEATTATTEATTATTEATTATTEASTTPDGSDNGDNNGDNNGNANTGDCDCICHSTDWFQQIFYGIARFFWEIFGVNRTCACGTWHYLF